MTRNSSVWRLTYTGVTLDRASALRSTDSDVEKLRLNPNTRVLPIWNGNHLFDEQGQGAVAVTSEHFDLFDQADWIFLGSAEDSPWFAVVIQSDEAPPSLTNLGILEPLHPRVGALESDQAALMAYARGMALWHLNHLHCGRCGAPTVSCDGGHIRRCSDESCGYRAFPRTDAAVIVLVEHPDGERCLLGRQSKWPEGMYSVVAGFVEPGESLEECVIREVKEETGIQVTDATYHASQPWPFPSSLMLGFSAKALTTDFKPHDDELDDIRWVTRNDLAQYGEMGDGTDGPKLPNRHSIARFLIDTWRGQASAHHA
ncbi:MAG: NAD(+) diphosphatase [Rhodospirillaceae bacterium]